VAACGNGDEFCATCCFCASGWALARWMFPRLSVLIADYFDRAERAASHCVLYHDSGAIYLVGYGLAGWLNELYGWRVMFMMLGSPDWR